MFPKLGKLPIGAIKASHLRPIIQGVVDRGAPTVAILIRQWSGQIFAYASGRALRKRPDCVAEAISEAPGFGTTAAVMAGHRSS